MTTGDGTEKNSQPVSLVKRTSHEGFTLTVTGQALRKEAGEAVVAVTVPTFSGVQNKHKTVCNLRHIQEGVQVSCGEKKKRSEARQMRPGDK